MSDSFADLWNTSAPLPAKPKPQTLSAAAAASSPSPTGGTTSKKADVFSLLAASSSSSSISNSGTLSRPITPSTIMRSQGSTPISSQSTRKDNGDAFADLFATTTTTTKSGRAGMTLAARLAMEAEERHRATTTTTTTLGVQSQDVSWVGLDSLEGPKDGFTSTPIQKTVNPTPTLWDIDDFNSTSTTTATATTAAPPSSSSSSSASYLKPQSRSTSRLSHHSSSQTKTRQQIVDSPDMDFDFGSREDQDQDRDRDIPTHTSKSSGTVDNLLLLDDDGDDGHDHLMGGIGNREYGFPRGKGLLDDVDDVVRGGTIESHDEDDILGVLSKPVEVVIAKKNLDSGSSKTSTTLSRSIPQGTSTSIPAPPSPPPHILGQIVEMGFSVSQAKKALAATTDGKDVQAALETLLNGGGGSNFNEPSPSTQVAQARPAPPPAHPNVRGPPKGQKERERERKERESQRTRREDTSPSTATTGSSYTTSGSTDIQDQADKLLLQASEIGMSVFNRASAFWKEGKEKVVKAMMEERGSGGFEERGRGKNVDNRPRGGVMEGRPKWMKAVVDDENDDEFREERGEGFKDSILPGIQERDDIDAASHGTVVEESEVDLFSSDPIPARSSASASQQRPSPFQRSSQHFHSQSHSRPPPLSRTLPTISSSTLSLSSTHKNTGTSQFKLGQYGPASESYTSAITLLPPGHLLLVPLYTNRSLSRLRCGEYAGAGEDAGEALKIICVSDSDVNTGNGNAIWNPDTELAELIQAGKERINEGGWSDLRGVGVDLVDGYVKALRRRAEAWEGREKWVEAGRDWEVLAGSGGGRVGGGGWIGDGIKKEAVRAAGRCRRMVNGGGEEGVVGSSSSQSKPPLSKPKPKPKPSSSRPPLFSSSYASSASSSSTPSKALLAHQATTLQAEADDSLKHQLKDSVDARIAAWKNGKETNIRALLASLDMVLWDEILMKGSGGGGGGLKVNGLGELVTDVQVKKGYVKAIAKVHPDKINASNSTVEQRMLANSVFAALNEAWIAFQGGK